MADKTGYIGRNPGDSSVIIAKQTYAPTGNQTDFAFAAGYTVGYLDVYFNGVRLISPTDYSATDGSNVILTTTAVSGDVLEFVAYKAFNIGNVTNAGGDFTVSNNLTVGGTYNIGISSAGTSITSNIKTLNFVGTGNTFKVSGNTVDVSISGGAGGASKIYDSTVFAYQNVVESDITIESPYKVATFYTSPDVTIDVEDDVTITVDSGCTLLAIDI